MTDQIPQTKKSPFKWFALGIGGAVAFAHLGIIGHFMNVSQKYAERVQYPSINLPTGKYSSYDVDVGRDGYRLRYNANDPKVLRSNTNIDRKSHKKGFFGGESSEDLVRSETHEFTMDGGRNIGGGETLEGGKLSAEQLACIKAAGSGESTGAVIGSSMTAGAVPVLSAIPYVGWLAAGWATMLGANMGSQLGSEIAETVAGC